jgi:PAS domain S-box-containing protein
MPPNRASDNMAHIASVAAEPIKARPRLRNLLLRGRLRIRTRLTACYVAIFLLMLVTNLIGLWQFRRMATSSQRLNQADQISLAAMVVHLDINTLRNRLAALADTQAGPKFASEAGSLRRKFLEDITHVQQLFSASTDVEHDPVILSALETLHVTLSAQVESVMALAAVNDWPAARLRLNNQMQGLIDLSSLLVERVDHEVSRQRAVAIQSAQQANRQLFLVLPATALVTMLIAVLLGWYVTRTITEPLSQLYVGAQALARGEFQHEVKVTGQDELGTVGDAFNYAARRLRELYDGLRDAEEAARRSESELLDLVENIPAMVFIALPGLANGFASRGWREYTGLSAEGTIGSGWQSVIHRDDLERHLEKWRVCLATDRPFEDEALFRRAADGEYRWFLVRAVPRREDGAMVKWYGVLTDIEDRKRAEEERERLRQLQAEIAHLSRVTTMGELTASLAHELNQPIAAAITSANACLRWLDRDPPDLDRARAAIARVDRDATRAGALIQRLRGFFKKDAPPQQQFVDLNEVAREMVELLRNEAYRYSVSTRTNLAPHVLQVIADRVQLQQVFMNLMLNAIDAMKDTGGELMIESGCSEDGHVMISVSDTGIGLPDGNKDRIFNAFFTTKPEGTGMGLAISRSIIESHGGRLWATNNAARGATFYFTLPVASAIEA